ncbi:uncharacterized protein UTRI_02568 [Ustilago trichophora]|uniref:Integrase catalytic domain-containing protein n=1 Tax=Ustilago trichophora TaxID=86804 RepID=A0A5C3E6Y0_9BASI|nr:uncharacterized protein UTRI_02568 [Ustilago trichophora]
MSGHGLGLGLPVCKGYDAAFVVVNLFLRMLITRACTSRATATDLYAMLSEMVLQRGFTPEVIVSDSDSRFVGQVGEKFAKAIGATLKPSAPYHQQANPVERHIQTLNRVLKALAMDHLEDWPSYLAAAELAINWTPSVTTGESPFDLVYISKVEKAVLPSVSLQTQEDKVAVAKARLDAAWQKALNKAATDKQTYNRRHCPLPSLQVGDLVFICLKDRPMPSTARFPKLNPAKLGPFPVSEVISKHRVRLQLPPDLNADPTFDVLQLDPAPKQPDPFGCPLQASPVTHPLAQPKNDLAEDSCQEAINDWILRDVLTPPPASHHLHDADEDSLIERPVAFISTTTSLAESKMAAIELKISCLAWAMHRLQHFLDGADTDKIIVVTDHAPLPAVLRLPSRSQRHFTPKIERLRAYLMPHLERMEFRYKQGKLHTNVNSLSQLERMTTT